jgi:hypothetical protein
VLCGVAVETASFNCASFEDCAGADALKMRTIQSANDPANRDFILITIPPSLDLAMIRSNHIFPLPNSSDHFPGAGRPGNLSPSHIEIPVAIPYNR